MGVIKLTPMLSDEALRGLSGRVDFLSFGNECREALVLLGSCTPLPESYAVPEQRIGREGQDPEPLGAFVTFADARSDDYAVKGFLPAAPAKDACRWCDYRPVCGPYEEQRVRRKPKDRLADLQRLRGLT